MEDNKVESSCTLVCPCTNSTDPFHLPDPVVDTILKYVDDQDMLNCRLVSVWWNTQITARNAFWKQRCERSVAKVTPVTTHSFFSSYFSCRRVVRQMATGGSLRVCENCQLETCAFSDLWAQAEAYNRSRRPPRRVDVAAPTPSTGAAPATPQLNTLSLGNNLMACTVSSELVVYRKKEKTVLWTSGQCDTDCLCLFKNHIFSVTCFGDIALYTFNGQRTPVSTGGKLRGARHLAVHKNGQYVLAGRENDVVLVDHSMRVFPLDLQLPRTTSDSHIFPIFHPSTEALTICGVKGNSFSIATVKADGQIMSVETLSNFIDMKYGRDQWRAVAVCGGHVVQEMIHHEGSRGVRKTQTWKKALCASASDLRPLAAGCQFLLAARDRALEVYRLDQGTLAAAFPDFFHQARPSVYATTLQEDISWAELNRLWHNVHTGVTTLASAAVVLNRRWLDGLSPSELSDSEHVPLCVTATPEGRIKCLHWSCDMCM